MKKSLAFFLVAFACLDARAIIPENGWWWNPATSGSGFNLEVQDNLLFFSSFGYDANGTPIWLAAGGAMSSDRDFTSALSSYGNGSCYGCSYHPPQSANAGSVSLHFETSQSATITINGVASHVERFDFWLNKTTPDAMLGEWSMVMGDSTTGNFFGERVQFRAKSSDNDGPFLTGYRLGQPASTAILRFNTQFNLYTMLLDSSAGFYRYSEWVTTGFNRIEGVSWLYQKGTTPTGPGTFFQGYRSASASFVQTGSGPASSKSLEFAVDPARAARLEALSPDRSRQ